MDHQLGISIKPTRAPQSYTPSQRPHSTNHPRSPFHSSLIFTLTLQKHDPYFPPLPLLPYRPPLHPQISRLTPKAKKRLVFDDDNNSLTALKKQKNLEKSFSDSLTSMKIAALTLTAIKGSLLRECFHIHSM